MRRSLSRPLRSCPSSPKGRNCREGREGSWEWGNQGPGGRKSQVCMGSQCWASPGNSGTISDPELCSRGTLHSNYSVGGASWSSVPWQFWDRKKMGGEKSIEQFAVGLKRDQAYRK